MPYRCNRLIHYMKLRYLSDLGKFVLWQKEVFRKPENWGMYYKELIRQMYDIGIGSLPIVLLIAVFLGAVTVVQFYYQMEGTLIPPYYIGYIVRDMMIIELAPMVTCLVLAGNVGSTMAAMMFLYLFVICCCCCFCCWLLFDGDGVEVGFFYFYGGGIKGASGVLNRSGDHTCSYLVWSLRRQT